MPMLPVTHGDKFTRLHVLLYTLILIAVTLMPYATKMSGLIYLAGAGILDVVFLYYAVKIYVDYSDQLAKKTFRYSIFYLAALFVVLLVDHYIRF
jgi:protoheme IX farnesyltransferase